MFKFVRKPPPAQPQFTPDASAFGSLKSACAAKLSPRATTLNPTPITKLSPATLAIVLQLAAMLCVLAFAWLLRATAVHFQLEFSLPWLVYVLLQALLAALFSVWLGMARWWRWIHAGFPLAIWFMALLQLPSYWYLLGFVFSLALFWTTFASQVPFYPSRPAVWQHLVQLLPASPLRIIDIGSGLGDLSMHVSQLRGDCSIEGIEIAPLPWLLSYVRARLRRSAAKFKLGDYRTADFAAYDVIFAYLSPVAMHDLWQKAQREMRPGSLLISYEFGITGVEATQTITTGNDRPPLYVWQMPVQ